MRMKVGELGHAKDDRRENRGKANQIRDENFELEPYDPQVWVKDGRHKERREEKGGRLYGPRQHKQEESEEEASGWSSLSQRKATRHSPEKGVKGRRFNRFTRVIKVMGS